MSQKRSKLEGFTLLEILLVVAAIAILAGIVILAINPGKQLGDTRNSERRSDVNTILNAVYEYAIDNDGVLPTGILASATCADATNEICKTGAADCTGLVELGELTLNEEYVTAIPSDPNGSSTNGTGYHIAENTSGRVSVCAPSAEQSEVISVTR